MRGGLALEQERLTGQDGRLGWLEGVALHLKHRHLIGPVALARGSFYLDHGPAAAHRVRHGVGAGAHQRDGEEVPRRQAGGVVQHRLPLLADDTGERHGVVARAFTDVEAQHAARRQPGRGRGTTVLGCAQRRQIEIDLIGRAGRGGGGLRAGNHLADYLYRAAEDHLPLAPHEQFVIAGIGEAVQQRDQRAQGAAVQRPVDEQGAIERRFTGFTLHGYAPTSPWTINSTSVTVALRLRSGMATGTRPFLAGMISYGSSIL